MKKVIISILAALTLCGCQTLKPIKTELKISDETGKSFYYSSEKDVICKVLIDPETGKINGFELSAVASAPALAQVERDTVNAQTSLAQIEALKELALPLARLVPALVAAP